MCSNVRNLGNEKEKVEIQVQCQTCDITQIIEMLRGQLTQLDYSQRKIQDFPQKQSGKIKRGVARYVKKHITCMGLFYRTDDKLAESL